MANELTTDKRAAEIVGFIEKKFKGEIKNV